MKLIKTASGKQTIKLSKKEWESIGKTAGWIDETPENRIKILKEKESRLKKEIMDLEERAKQLEVGDKVEFTDTMFRGFPATLLAIDGENCTVEINLLSRKVALSYFDKEEKAPMKLEYIKAFDPESDKKLEGLKRSLSGTQFTLEGLLRKTSPDEGESY
jgi:transcription antitermination factor NusG